MIQDKIQFPAVGDGRISRTYALAGLVI